MSDEQLSEIKTLTASLDKLIIEWVKQMLLKELESQKHPAAATLPAATLPAEPCLTTLS